MYHWHYVSDAQLVFPFLVPLINSSYTGTDAVLFIFVVLFTFIPPPEDPLPTYLLKPSRRNTCILSTTNSLSYLSFMIII